MFLSDRFIGGNRALPATSRPEAPARRDRAWTMGLAAALLLACGGGPARAQDAPATPAEPAPTVKPVPELMESGTWQLSMTPYIWATSLHGQAGAKGYKTDVDVSFSDLLKDLNGAAMLDLELRKGPFALITDTVFANLQSDGSGPEGRLKVKATANELVQNVAGTYRVGTWQLHDFGDAGALGVTLDPYAGIRYTYLDTELKGRLDLPDLGIDAKRTAEGDKQWVDPMVGLRTIWTLGDRLSLIVAGDVGGTGNDDHSWEAYGVVGYRFSLFGENNANVLAGYKVLDQRYIDGNGDDRFQWDITMKGPVLGLTIRF